MEELNWTPWQFPGFYSMFGSLESLLNLEQKHEIITAISIEVFTGVLQTEQKHIG